MPNTAQLSPDYFDVQYNARATIPDHPALFSRWAATSARLRTKIAARLDLAYGDAEAEKLDFFPATSAGGPLLVFIHGGWWRSLDKSDFSFVAPAFTQAGIHVAVTNYTLAPAATIEEIVLQQTRALAWLVRQADDLGFDRRRIVIAGHSAGAHLSAMLMTAIWSQVDASLPGNLIKGGVLLSGLYDLAPIQHAAFVNGDLKLTPKRIARLSPARLPQSHVIPFFTAVGGLESDEFQRQTALIGKSWPAGYAGQIALPKHNHLTICDALATPGHPLCDSTIRLVHLTKGQVDNTKSRG